MQNLLNQLIFEKQETNTKTTRRKKSYLKYNEDFLDKNVQKMI